MHEGVVLLARDSYGGRSLPELASLAESVRMQSGTWVSYAMVDGATPSLVDVLERASFEGVDRLVVFVACIGTSGDLGSVCYVVNRIANNCEIAKCAALQSC